MGAAVSELKFPRAILWFAIFAHLAAAGWTAAVPEAMFTADSSEYIQAGQNLINRGLLYSGNLDEAIELRLYSRRPPAYPALLGVCLWLGGLQLALLTQVGLALGGACFVWGILQDFRAPRLVAASIIALYLLYPAQLIYSHVVMAEIPLQFCLLASLFATSRFLKTGRARWLVAVNLFLCLAVLTKPIMVYFWVPNLLFHTALCLHRRRLFLILPALLPLLTVTLWSYRNWTWTGYFHFSSIKSANLAIINVPGMIRRSGDEEAAGEYRRRQRERLADSRTFAEASREVEREFFAQAIRNWDEVLVSYAVGAVTFFLDPGRFDLAQFFQLKDQPRVAELRWAGLGKAGEFLRRFGWGVSLYLVTLLLINTAILAGLLFWLVQRPLLSEFRLFLFLLVAYVIVMAGPSGLSRFRVSVFPYLLLAMVPMIGVLFRCWGWRRGTRPKEGAR